MMPDSCALTRTTQGNPDATEDKTVTPSTREPHAAGGLPESGGEVIGCGKLPSGDRYMAWLVWPWDELDSEARFYAVSSIGRLI